MAWASFGEAEANVQERVGDDAPVPRKDPIRITKLETFLVKPRWLFLKVHTDAGIVGLGEPVVEGRARTVATAIEEIAPYLVGKDPRRVVHHWQAIYRHAFYRGGPILTSALSGIDMALWDIKGKALGVPVYELLGGPTRTRVRVYAHARTPAQVKEHLARGFTAFKTGPAKRRPARYVETPAAVRYAAERFAELREVAGDEADIGIDFHGAISPATAKLLIKALEPYQPMFIEEPVAAQNHDVMAEIARGTHLPIATGERVYTKWGFREVLEKRRGDDPPAGPLPRRGDHRGPADRRDGGGVLRGDRAAQPAGADLAGGGGPARGVDPELPLPGAGEPGRGLSEAAVHGAQGIPGPADGAGPGDRAGRGGPGRQDRTRLEESGDLRCGRRVGGRLVGSRPRRQTVPR